METHGADNRRHAKAPAPACEEPARVADRGQGARPGVTGRLRYRCARPMQQRCVMTAVPGQGRPLIRVCRARGRPRRHGRLGKSGAVRCSVICALRWTCRISVRSCQGAQVPLEWPDVGSSVLFVVLRCTCRAISSPWSIRIKPRSGTRLETPLRSDAAAIQLARKVIEGIREDRGPAEPDPALTVRNVAGEIVYRLPVN